MRGFSLLLGGPGVLRGVLLVSRIERIAAGAWRERARQEREAAAAFRALADGLEREGAPAELTELATRAIDDEQRHARLCAELAGALGANVTLVDPVAPPTSPAGANREGLLAMVALSCITETLSTVLLTAMRERARRDDVRAVVHEVLRDEIRHARIGWGYLSWRRGSFDGEAVGRALPRLLSDTVSPLAFEPETDASLARELEGLGCLCRATVIELLRATLLDVVCPGLEQHGIDAVPARAWLDARCGVTAPQ